MNKNFKKVAIALLATNVIANMVITSLPPVQTHAAENKLKATSTTSSVDFNPVFVTDTLITGTAIPNSKILLEAYSDFGAYKYATKLVDVDSKGNFTASLEKWTLTNDTEDGVELPIYDIRVINAYYEGVTDYIYGGGVYVSLESRFDAALNATRELFVSNNPDSHIKDTTNQFNIDAAQTLVNQISYSAQKVEAQDRINKAQAELNIRNVAISSVNDLFIANNPTNHIKDTTNQATIDKAQDKVNKVTSPSKQEDLQVHIDKAKTELNATNSAKDYSLSVEPYKVGDATLSGEYGKGIAKVHLRVNNVVVAQAMTNADGTYTFKNVPSYVKLGTDTVEVIAINSTEQEVARKAITLETKSCDLVANAYTVGSKALEGIHGKDIAKVRLKVNGVIVTQATTDGKGNYTFANATKFIKSFADKVEVVGVDVRYTERARQTVSISEPEIKNYRLVANVYAIDNETLKGGYGTDIAKVRLLVNGVAVAQAITDGKGNYTFSNPTKFIKSLKDKVEVVGVDASYTERARQTVSLFKSEKNYRLSAIPYTLGDRTLIGMYGKDIAKVRLVVNGVIVAQASTNFTGHYTFSNPTKFIKSLKDKVEVVGVDVRYTERARQTISLSAS
ncbi:hypothetical protein HCJ39_11465 [Listeria rocourtiae]|uniref:immunoglobulin-like domain-containing protein n=1 Tax=Listeria rocourtiae TaxID=647910 RepID=UPI0016232CA4|nr:immunoglobulin-like domain-containing protein [Listeria rocourtiae]MBC1605335.1 hypothetical protein [Listeria rocourtiae]